MREHEVIEDFERKRFARWKHACGSGHLPRAALENGACWLLAIRPLPLHRRREQPRLPIRGLKRAPARNMRAHERLKQSSVIRNTQMEKLVGDHKILESTILLRQIPGQRHDASGRT